MACGFPMPWNSNVGLIYFSKKFFIINKCLFINLFYFPCYCFRNLILWKLSKLVFNFADFSLIEINFSYRRFWNFVLGSYPSMWYSISLRSFVNRTKWPSETRLFQFANFSQTGTAVYWISRLKRRGESTPLCLTPLVTFNLSDLQPFHLTLT